MAKFTQADLGKYTVTRTCLIKDDPMYREETHLLDGDTMTPVAEADHDKAAALADRWAAASGHTVEMGGVTTCGNWVYCVDDIGPADIG
jgi:N-methylhydantoinase B/oxoprolinase/acetone carboxylase alpha subunit